VAWYSSTIDWWCLKACISVKFVAHDLGETRDQGLRVAAG
jgi:hypothetical protein